MTIKEAFDLWNSNPCSKQMVSHFKRCGVYDAIMESTEFLNSVDSEFPFSQRVYLSVNNYTDFPKCPECGTPNTKTGISLNGYIGEKIFCSKCTYKHRTENVKRSLFEREGITNVSQRDSVKTKKIETCLYKSDGRYTNPSQNPDIQKLKRDNCLHKSNGLYTSQSQNPEVIAKHKDTVKKRYNVDNVSQLDWVKQKKEDTSLQNRGTPYWSMTEDGKRYLSTISILNSKSRHDKTVEHYMKLFGVDNYMKLPEYKEKFRVIKLSKTYNRLLSSQYVEPLFSLDEWLRDPDFEFSWKCKKCGNVFKVSRNINDRPEGPFYARCLDCFKKTASNTSKPEIELVNYLKTFLDCDIICNSHDIINPYELDIYIPDYQIAFEYNGSYWHSNKYKDEDYHQLKSDLCLNQNIQLYYIHESEWIDNQDFMKLKIQSLFKNTSDTRKIVFSDKCVDRYLYQLNGFIDNKLAFECLYIRQQSDTILCFQYDEFEILNFEERKIIINYFSDTYSGISEISWIVNRDWPQHLNFLLNNQYSIVMKFLPSLRNSFTHNLCFDFDYKFDENYYDCGRFFVTKLFGVKK